MPGLARPVRMVAKSSLATSKALSILSSASSNVSSITSGSSFRRWVGTAGSPSYLSGVDQRPDLLTADGPDDVSLALHPEDDHRQLVLLGQRERRRIHHAQP